MGFFGFGKKKTTDLADVFEKEAFQAERLKQAKITGLVKARREGKAERDAPKKSSGITGGLGSIAGAVQGFNRNVNLERTFGGGMGAAPSGSKKKKGKGRDPIEEVFGGF